MSVANQLARLVGPVLDGELPVRIRAWDGSAAGPSAAPVVHVASRRALRRLLWQPGELGLAQAYVTGDLDADGGADGLDAALRAAWHAVQQRDLRPTRPRIAGMFAMATRALRLGTLGPRPRVPASQIRVTGRRHSVERDRAIIAGHYDLSNEFYALFTDPTMAYSCGFYPDGDTTLHEAQVAKLDLICRKLDLRSGMRLLDVGCGWGSLVLHAAERYGVQALGVTLSEQQHAYVAKQVAERGLTGQVEVRLQDYRDLDEEPFDAIASIEMGEHVGQTHYRQYADVLARHLRPRGRLLLQQMSRSAEAAPGGGPFIEGFIAPDMHMRPLEDTVGFCRRAGLEVLDVQPMREHYVRTVTDWLHAFERRHDEVVAMLGQERARVWRLYLVGGRLAFEQGRMGVDQILMRR